MLIIPAIDIKDEQCVRLRQGKIENLEVFAQDPCIIAQNWAKEGAPLIHIVDLDGAFQGKPCHKLIIKRILEKINIPIQVGGGIRDESVIREYLDYGVWRVVLGTMLITQKPEKVKDIIRKFGNKVVAGVDVKNNHIAIEGWINEVSRDVSQFIDFLVELGFQHIIYTDIKRDGMMKGPNIAMVKDILQKNTLQVIASGGISSIGDLYQLKELEELGLEGVIIGKALYRGDIVLADALKIFYKRDY